MGMEGLRATGYELMKVKSMKVVVHPWNIEGVQEDVPSNRVMLEGLDFGSGRVENVAIPNVGESPFAVCELDPRLAFAPIVFRTNSSAVPHIFPYIYFFYPSEKGYD